jgi:hypothetical protein
VSKSYRRGHFGKWRSLAAHLLWEQGVAGSNPAFPTTSGQMHGGVGQDRDMDMRARIRAADDATLSLEKVFPVIDVDTEGVGANADRWIMRRTHTGEWWG